MNERDYFAGLAMQALIERAGEDSVRSAANESAQIAETAYDIAGAMVGEREKRNAMRPKPVPRPWNKGENQ